MVKIIGGNHNTVNHQIVTVMLSCGSVRYEDELPIAVMVDHLGQMVDIVKNGNCFGSVCVEK